MKNDSVMPCVLREISLLKKTNLSDLSCNGHLVSCYFRPRCFEIEMLWASFVEDLAVCSREGKCLSQLLLSEAGERSAGIMHGKAGHYT